MTIKIKECGDNGVSFIHNITLENLNFVSTILHRLYSTYKIGAIDGRSVVLVSKIDGSPAYIIEKI